MVTTDLASIQFSLQWKSSYATHNDRRFVDNVHFWRDIFPDNFDNHLGCLGPGKSHRQEYGAGVLVPPFDKRRITTFKNFHLTGSQERLVTPETGKFYPQGWAWRALNCFPQNTTPFRVVDKHQELIVADTNHPLSRYPLTLEAQIIERYKAGGERGGVCNDLAALITGEGPGMQIPYQWNLEDSYSPYPFPRQNEVDDSTFYQQQRLVNHLDDRATEEVGSIHGRLLHPGIKILDLMGSWNSHLTSSHDSCQVTGLGLNQEELWANPCLNETIVHDLNRIPKLPFADNSFQAVICTASIEYLTQPLEVLAEIARVTTPGGIFITTFSDRWFPGKEINIWADLHPFERLGLIVDYYHKTKKFEKIHTESIVGLPRPLSDRHIRKTRVSDPIFAVWGKVKW